MQHTRLLDVDEAEQYTESFENSLTLRFRRPELETAFRVAFMRQTYVLHLTVLIIVFVMDVTKTEFMGSIIEGPLIHIATVGSIIDACSDVPLIVARVLLHRMTDHERAVHFSARFYFFYYLLIVAYQSVYVSYDVEFAKPAWSFLTIYAVTSYFAVMVVPGAPMEVRFGLGVVAYVGITASPSWAPLTKAQECYLVFFIFALPFAVGYALERAMRQAHWHSWQRQIRPLHQFC